MTALTVIDADKWQKVLRAVEPVAERQVRSADIIVINKTDQNPDWASIIPDVNRIAQDRIVLSILTLANSGNALEKLLES